MEQQQWVGRVKEGGVYCKKRRVHKVFNNPIVGGHCWSLGIKTSLDLNQGPQERSLNTLLL